MRISPSFDHFVDAYGAAPDFFRIEMDGADDGEEAPQQEEFLTQEKTAEARRFEPGAHSHSRL